MIKYFLSKIGEKYSKEARHPIQNSKVKGRFNSKVMEIITLPHINSINTAGQLHETVDEEYLLSLFDEYSDFMSPNSD